MGEREMTTDKQQEWAVLAHYNTDTPSTRIGFYSEVYARITYENHLRYARVVRAAWLLHNGEVVEVFDNPRKEG